MFSLFGYLTMVTTTCLIVYIIPVVFCINSFTIFSFCGKPKVNQKPGQATSNPSSSGIGMFFVGFAHWGGGVIIGVVRIVRYE